MTIDELYNILLNDKPSDIIRKREEELFSLIPELKKCKGFNQHNDWHIYDVYEHILHVVDNVPSNLILRLSALFHDIGKPFSYTEDENGVGHFYGHWEVSQTIFNEFAEKYIIDKDISDKVSKLIYYHDINLDKISGDELKKMINIFSKEEIEQLYELKKADLLSQNHKYNYILDEYENQKKKLVRLK